MKSSPGWSEFRLIVVTLLGQLMVDRRTNGQAECGWSCCQCFVSADKFRWAGPFPMGRCCHHPTSKNKTSRSKPSHGQKRSQQDEQEQEEEEAATATAVEEEEEEVETNDDWKRDRTRKPSPGGGAAAGFKLHRLCHPGLLFAVDSSN